MLFKLMNLPGILGCRYDNYDCDGDGLPDPVCQHPTVGYFGVIGSAASCDKSWPSAPACPTAVLPLAHTAPGAFGVESWWSGGTGGKGDNYFRVTHSQMPGKFPEGGFRLSMDGKTWGPSIQPPDANWNSAQTNQWEINRDANCKECWRLSQLASEGDKYFRWADNHKCVDCDFLGSNLGPGMVHPEYLRQALLDLPQVTFAHVSTYERHYVDQSKAWYAVHLDLADGTNVNDLRFQIIDAVTINNASSDVHADTNWNISSTPFAGSASPKNDLFFNPIPDDMLEMKKSTPVVRVEVNAINAVCETAVGVYDVEKNTDKQIHTYSSVYDQYWSFGGLTPNPRGWLPKWDANAGPRCITDRDSGNCSWYQIDMLEAGLVKGVATVGHHSDASNAQWFVPTFNVSTSVDGAVWSSHVTMTRTQPSHRLMERSLLPQMETARYVRVYPLTKSGAHPVMAVGVIRCQNATGSVCNDNTEPDACGFEYDDTVTPQVSTISTSATPVTKGTVLTIGGTGFTVRGGTYAFVPHYLAV